MVFWYRYDQVRDQDSIMDSGLTTSTLTRSAVVSGVSGGAVSELEVIARVTSTRRRQRPDGLTVAATQAVV